MSVQADVAPPPPEARRRGFMFGELLVAVVLLLIAISSVTALMYSVGRHPRQRETVDCTAKAAATLAKCAKSSPAKASATKAKTASAASLELLPKRPEKEVRPDLGFIR